MMVPEIVLIPLGLLAFMAAFGSLGFLVCRIREMLSPVDFLGEPNTLENRSMNLLFAVPFACIAMIAFLVGGSAWGIW